MCTVDKQRESIAPDWGRDVAQLVKRLVLCAVDKQRESTAPDWGRDVAQLVERWILCAADTGLTQQFSKGFFSWSQLSVQALSQCSYSPDVHCVH